MKKLCNCESKGKMHCHCNKYITIIIVILVIVLIWLGVNKNHKDKDIDSKINTNKILVSGSGNEPGWNVKVFGEDFNQGLFKTDFILDYGDAIYSGILGKSSDGSIDTNFQFRGNVNMMINGTISTSTKNVILYFEKAECIDDSGAKKDYKVDLNLNSEKEYKGCASLDVDAK